MHTVIFIFSFRFQTTRVDIVSNPDLNSIRCWQHHIQLIDTIYCLWQHQQRLKTYTNFKFIKTWPPRKNPGTAKATTTRKNRRPELYKKIFLFFLTVVWRLLLWRNMSHQEHLASKSLVLKKDYSDENKNETATTKNQHAALTQNISVNNNN